MAGDFRRGLSDHTDEQDYNSATSLKDDPENTLKTFTVVQFSSGNQLHIAPNSYAYLHWLWAALVFSQESNSDSNLVGPNSVIRPKLKYYKLISLNSLRVPFLVMERINVSYRCLRASMQGT